MPYYPPPSESPGINFYGFPLYLPWVGWFEPFLGAKYEVIENASIFL